MFKLIFSFYEVPKESESFYVNPCGDMAGYSAKKGSWDQKNITDMCGGVKV